MCVFWVLLKREWPPLHNIAKYENQQPLSITITLLRHFCWAPTTYDLDEKKEQIFSIAHSYLETSQWKTIPSCSATETSLTSERRLNPLPHRNVFKTFANMADPDQAVLVRAVWSGSTLFAYWKMIRYDPTLVDLRSNIFVLYTKPKV